MINHKYIPLYIPTNMYQVLFSIDKIGEGIKGKNITTGLTSIPILIPV